MIGKDIRPVWYPSPNYTEGRKNPKTGVRYLPEAIVIHISEGTLESMRSWFGQDASDVSAHYGVDKDGDLDQYVDETDTAWANGRVIRPTWGLLKPSVNPNLYTISIEHALVKTEVDEPDEPWPQAMIDRSCMLIAEMHVRWGIPIDAEHVVGHHRIFADKPHCPTPNSIVRDLIRGAQARLM